MKNWIALFVLVLTASVLSAQEMPFEKSGQEGLIPVIKNGYRPQISIAPQAAFITFDDLDTEGIAFGGEIALQCPLFCTKKNYIRQQVSFLYYEDEDQAFTHWTAILNPEYRFIAKPTFEMGAGIGLGVANNKIGTWDKTMFTYGVSTSANVHFGSFFAGAGARYLFTPAQDLVLFETNFNNFQVAGKVGVKF